MQKVVIISSQNCKKVTSGRKKFHPTTYVGVGFSLKLPLIPDLSYRNIRHIATSYHIQSLGDCCAVNSIYKMSDKLSALVMDNGSGTLKAGFAEDDAPR